MRSLALEDQLLAGCWLSSTPATRWRLVGGEEIEVRKAAWRFFDPFVVCTAVATAQSNNATRKYYPLLWLAFGLASPQSSLSQTLCNHVLSHPLFIRFRLFCSTLFPPRIIEIVVYGLNTSKTISYCQNYAEVLFRMISNIFPRLNWTLGIHSIIAKRVV